MQCQVYLEGQAINDKKQQQPQRGISSPKAQTLGHDSETISSTVFGMEVAGNMLEDLTINFLPCMMHGIFNLFVFLINIQPVKYLFFSFFHN